MVRAANYEVAALTVKSEGLKYSSCPPIELGYPSEALPVLDTAFRPNRCPTAGKGIALPNPGFGGFVWALAAV